MGRLQIVEFTNEIADSVVVEMRSCSLSDKDKSCHRDVVGADNRETPI